MTTDLGSAFQHEWSAIVERCDGNDLDAAHLDDSATRARPHPARLQRRRRPPGLAAQCSNPNGWVCVDRSTRWGNWYKVERRDTPNGLSVAWAVVGPDNQPVAWPQDLAAAHRRAVDLFAADIAAGALDPNEIRGWLRGRDLACYCAPGLACHAYVLLAIANEDYVCLCPVCKAV